MGKPRCTGTVEECTSCQWRGHNHVGQPCTKCGADVAARPCRKYPRKGTTVCDSHGGTAPQVQAAAARRIAEQLISREAGQLLDELGEHPEQHPVERLLDALDQAGTMVAALRLLVAGLDLTAEFEIERNEKGDPHYRVTKAGFTGPLPTGAGAPNVLVAMYGEWLDRYAKFAKLALDAGVDERRTQLAEATTNRLFTAVDAALDTLPAKHRDEFRVALADQLRSIAA